MTKSQWMVNVRTMLMQEPASIHEGSEIEVDWREVDRNLRRIAQQRGALDADEMRWLREALRGEVWRALGEVSLLAYLERRLGYGPRAASDRVRVALALEDLPELTEALDVGELAFSAIRELTRVAIPRTEAAWREHGRGKNLRQIEQAVSGRRPGDLPTDPPRPEIVMRTLRFEVRPETFARLRQVQQMLEAEAGERLDDDALIAAMCESVLQPRDGAATQAQHQIVTIECECCGQGWRQGGGVRVAIDKAAVARAECDAQRIDPKTLRATQDVTPRVRRFVWRRDGGRCCVPGCRSSRYLELHHIRRPAEGGSHGPGNLTLLCDAHHRLLHDGLLTISGTAPRLVVSGARTEHAYVGIERLGGEGAVEDAHVGSLEVTNSAASPP